jgi:hypothetical protein
MLVYRASIVAALAILGVSIPLIAQNGEGKCSTRMMTGTYGFTCEGVAPPAPGAADIPVAFLGIVTSDGTGKFVGHATAGFGGMFMDQYVSTEGMNGQRAEVGPDCNGDIVYDTWNGPPDNADSVYMGPLPIHFAVVDDGNQIIGLPTTPGYVLTCHLIRIRSQE